ncbi:hypothetical protein MPSEU_000510100 [Mayamaea pseudoterrestris]|nr:hypothetical protein MPSEU_000510100 [Mayamaea pseudoterrestris]
MNQLLALLYLLLSLTNLSVAQENCSCSFTVSADDEDGCKVYGQLGNDVLIPYNRASQDCLDKFNIRIRALDTDQVESLCGPPVSVTGLVNFIKFDSSSAANALKSQLSPMFFDSNEDGSVYTLRSNITSSSDGSNSLIDCTASSSDCWSEISNYLTNDDKGAALLETMCDELYARLNNGYELEQSTVRIAICNAIADTQTTGSDSCTDLYDQISDIQASDAAPNDCSAFGLGPAENEIPDACVSGPATTTDDDDAATDDDNATDDGDDTSREISGRVESQCEGLLLLSFMVAVVVAAKM